MTHHAFLLASDRADWERKRRNRLFVAACALAYFADVLTMYLIGGGEMKITEITVSAGRTFNNPYEQYANLRPGVELRATLEDGEEPLAALKKLQEQAETLVEHHKARLLADLDKLHAYTDRTRNIARLQEQINEATDRLHELKREQDKAGPLQLTAMDDSEILF